MIKYTTKLENIDESQLEGFFVGWPNPLSEETFFKLLKGSYRVVLAVKDTKVIGFITAVSD